MIAIESMLILMTITILYLLPHSVMNLDKVWYLSEQYVDQWQQISFYFFQSHYQWNEYRSKIEEYRF